MYRPAMTDQGYPPDEQTNVRLYVMKLETGSLEVEIAAAGMAIGAIMALMEYSNTFWQFTSNIKTALDYFMGRGPPQANLDKATCANLKAFLDVVADQPNGSISYTHARFSKRTGDEEVVAEFSFDKPEVDELTTRLQQEIERQEAEVDEGVVLEVRRNVMLMWHQTNREAGKSTGQRTGDKAVIASISDKAVPTFFPKGAEVLKRHMVDREENPFKKIFEVDVHVVFRDGKPQSYTILDFHRSYSREDPNGSGLLGRSR